MALDQGYLAPGGRETAGRGSTGRPTTQNNNVGQKSRSA